MQEKSESKIILCDEYADMMIYCIMMTEVLEVDLEEIILRKLKQE